MKMFAAAACQIQSLYLKHDSKILEYQLHKTELSKQCSSKHNMSRCIFILAKVILRTEK